MCSFAMTPDQTMAVYRLLEQRGQGGVGQMGSPYASGVPMGYGYGAGSPYAASMLGAPWQGMGGMGMMQPQAGSGMMGGFQMGYFPYVQAGRGSTEYAAAGDVIAAVPEEERAALAREVIEKMGEGGLDPAKAGELLETQTTWTGALNAAGLAAGIGTTIGNMWIQHDTMTKMARLQQNHMDNMKELSEKYMTTQVDIANIGLQVEEGRNDLMRDLAYIQADLEKAKAEILSKTSIANTKTVARYGFLNGQFYGTTQRSTHRYT